MLGDTDPLFTASSLAKLTVGDGQVRRETTTDFKLSKKDNLLNVKPKVIYIYH